MSRRIPAGGRELDEEARPGARAREQPAGTALYAASLGALFFLSGALGLIYEIVWFRRLHLALGVSIFAVGAVVSAFMLGLAAGSRWAARSAWLRGAPLEAYARFEIGIALYALAFPILVDGIEALYPALFHLLEGHFLALSATRFALAFAVLLPPTFLMGASLPAMAAAAVGPPDEQVRRVVWLYALNTVGGTVGTLAAGFFLIEHLGIVRSLVAGAAGGALVAGGALALARHPAYRDRGAEPAEERPRRAGPRRGRARPPLAALATATALVVGSASLASEIVWTRALVFFVHNSTYAFSAILAVYLLGIAAGAVLATRFVRATGNAVRALAAVLTAGSLSLLGAIAAYRHLPELAGHLARGPRLAEGVAAAPAGTSMLVGSWGAALLVIFAQVAAVLLLPALLLGAAFPLALKLAEGDGTPAAELVGRLYALNAVGSVAGALLGTFALVALLGTRGALLFVAWLPAPLGLWALWASGAGRRRRFVLAGLLIVAMAGGSVLAAPRGFYRQLFASRFGPVAWFSEGVAETVAVCDHEDGSRWIQFSDGRGASGTWSYQGGWLYAHLPLLLHPRPARAVVVCFGTGNTLGAASQHPLEVLDGVELSPEVVRAAPLFAKTNHDVARNEKVRIIIDDGRSYFLGTDRRYDVITEEPPLVHTAGVVNLYSRDFYELCARRMTDDGIMAVWLATWELEAHDLRMLVRAFVDVFPWASVWDCTHPGEWVLVGSRRAPALDLERLEERMRSPGIARDLARIDVELGGIRDSADLLSLHLMGREAMVAFAGSAEPVTDDRSVVDFTTPRRARANFGLGEWVTGGLTAVGVDARGLTSELRLRDFDRIYARRESALPLVGEYGARSRESFAAALRERTWLREMEAARTMLAALRRLAGDYLALGQPERALDSLGHGLTLVPAEARGPLHAMRGRVLRRLGRPDEARDAEASAARAEEARRDRAAAGGEAAPETTDGGR